MDNISLYRKYRPFDFDNLVGQDHIKTTLVNGLKSGHVSQAYLFAGPRGTGKTSTARLIAKSLNCQKLKDSYNPCNSCEFCMDINSGRLIDLIEIDAASNRGIDEIRDLREKINFSPTRTKYKIYIIDEVHMLTKEAFNALLKTLEEPPEHAYFILATTEIHKIPDTIISRCQRFDFKRITKDDIYSRLVYISKQEKINSDDEALKIISKSADGGLRDAIGLFEQMIDSSKVTLDHVQKIMGICNSSFLDNLFSALMKKNTENALQIIEELHNQGSSLKQFMHEFINLLRDKLLEAVSKDDQKNLNSLVKIIEIFQQAQQKLDSSIPQLPLEIAVIRVSFLLGESIEQQASKPLAPPLEVVPNVENIKITERKHRSPTQTAPEALVKLNIELIRENWPRIIERITIPALRMSLKSSHPLKIEDKNLTLQFDTNFHMNKVMESDHRVDLEKNIQEVLNCTLKIIGVVKEIEIKPVVDEVKDEEIQSVPSNNIELVNNALDIFGGEVMND